MKIDTLQTIFCRCCYKLG